MIEEGALVAQARAGSTKAFTELLRLYQGRVRAYLGRHLRDQDMADDLAQEVFLTAFRTLDTYRGDVPLVIWLIGIARNLGLTFLRGEARRRAREAGRLETALAAWRVQSLESNAGSPAEDDQRISALRECLKGLPEKSASMIQQRYFQGLSAARVASSWDTSENVVRVTLVRIRQALRRCVDQRIALEGR